MPKCSRKLFRLHFGYLFLMRYLALLLIFLLIIGSVGAQDKDCVNDYYARQRIIDSMLKSYRPIYDFHKHERIASIGAGSANREIIYSMMADSLTFYLQDINPVCLEPEILLATTRRLYAVTGLTCTASFIPIRGRTKETKLPTQFFDKIIIENSLHEFEFPDEMLRSVRDNLKKGGCIFIAETLSRRPGKKHIDCRKPMYTEETLIEQLKRNGFRLTRTDKVYPFNDYGKVFKFEIAE